MARTNKRTGKGTSAKQTDVYLSLGEEESSDIIQEPDSDLDPNTSSSVSRPPERRAPLGLRILAGVLAALLILPTFILGTATLMLNPDLDPYAQGRVTGRIALPLLLGLAAFILALVFQGRDPERRQDRFYLTLIIALAMLLTLYYTLQTALRGLPVT